MAKPSIDPKVWQPPKAPERAKQRGSTEQPNRIDVFTLPSPGAEDVVIDTAGRIYAGVEDGRILRISPDGSEMVTVADTGGRPLGLEVDPAGGLFVCDCKRGLLHADVATGTVRTLVEAINGVPMLFCSNSALASDGTIYFSESSQLVSLDNYRADVLAHSQTGRLSRRLPDGTVEVVLEGLRFGNGLVLAPDESWIAVAETSGYCITKLWLSGPNAGQREPLVQNMPGFPDNMSVGSDGLIWVALPTARDRLLDMLLPRAPLLRKIAWALPEALQPHEKPMLWVQAYDMNGALVHDLQTTHDKFFFATGVSERDGVVWVASVTAPTIARLELASRGEADH